ALGLGLAAHPAATDDQRCPAPSRPREGNEGFRPPVDATAIGTALVSVAFSLSRCKSRGWGRPEQDCLPGAMLGSGGRALRRVRNRDRYRSPARPPPETPGQ